MGPWNTNRLSYNSVDPLSLMGSHELCSWLVMWVSTDGRLLAQAQPMTIEPKACRDVVRLLRMRVTRCATRRRGCLPGPQRRLLRIRPHPSVLRAEEIHLLQYTHSPFTAHWLGNSKTKIQGTLIKADHVQVHNRLTSKYERNGITQTAFPDCNLLN